MLGHIKKQDTWVKNKQISRTLLFIDRQNKLPAKHGVDVGCSTIEVSLSEATARAEQIYGV